MRSVDHIWVLTLQGSSARIEHMRALLERDLQLLPKHVTYFEGASSRDWGRWPQELLPRANLGATPTSAEWWMPSRVVRTSSSIPACPLSRAHAHAPPDSSAAAPRVSFLVCRRRGRSRRRGASAMPPAAVSWLYWVQQRPTIQQSKRAERRLGRAAPIACRVQRALLHAFRCRCTGRVSQDGPSARAAAGRRHMRHNCELLLFLCKALAPSFTPPLFVLNWLIGRSPCCPVGACARRHYFRSRRAVISIG